MSINLAAIRAKLAAERAGSTPIPVPTASVPPPTIPTTTTQVMSQVNKMVQSLPVDDPKLSAEENYLRQASASEVQDKIQELSERLLTEHPTMPVLLQEIHKLLKQQPDNVTLLSDEQIGAIVSGLLRTTSTQIATTTKKKKVSQKLTLEDLGF